MGHIVLLLARPVAISVMVMVSVPFIIPHSSVSLSDFKHPLSLSLCLCCSWCNFPGRLSHHPSGIRHSTPADHQAHLSLQSIHRKSWIPYRHCSPSCGTKSGRIYHSTFQRNLVSSVLTPSIDHHCLLQTRFISCIAPQSLASMPLGIFLSSPTGLWTHWLWHLHQSMASFVWPRPTLFES